MISNISRYVLFETQKIGCELSLMEISYILTKRTTKTEKFEKYSKMYIISSKTKGYELTASSNIINSILNYKFKRLVSNLRLHKDKKQAKTTISRKKLSKSFQEKKDRKVSKALKNEFFNCEINLNFFNNVQCFSIFGILFYQYNFKKIKHEQIH